MTKVKTKLGITLLVVLLVVAMLMNTLLNTFGETLSSYVGGGTVAATGDGSVMDEMTLLAEGREMDTELLAEGAVLLRNENNALPLAMGEKVTILGAQSYNYINGGTGSAGGKYDEYTYSMKEAFDGSKQDGSGAEGASPVMDYDGDGKASTGTTYLQLSEDEKNLLKFCKENYNKVIVLVNSSAVIELGEVEEYGIDAVLWIGHPGEAGLVGVAQVLTGVVSPSGRLVDTYAYDMSTMPAFYNNDDNKYTNVADIVSGFGVSTDYGFYQYEEGIYVGYRWYETADAVGFFDSDFFVNHEWKNGKAQGYEQVVQYPFGYGLSYTTFDWSVASSDVALQPHGTNSITVKVTNTGSEASKDLVELYMQAPYNTDDSCGIKGTGLQKAHKVLMGFQKTRLLQPGESQEVTITFETDELASFDSYGHGCYVLERGEYLFHVGKNAHVDGCDGVKANLASSIIYDETGAGARNADNSIAKVAMSDVDAGDGNMLEGYLNRDDFAGGFTQIMTHESSSKTEAISDALVEVMSTGALGTTMYTYTTYENGVKVTKTVPKYVNGTSYLAYSAEPNWEGLTQDDVRYYFDDVVDNHVIDYNQVYYVVVDESGNAVVDDNGNYQVTTEETSMRLDVNAPILKDAGYDNEIWAYLVDQTSIDEQIAVAGGMGWQTPAVPSLNKERTSVVDGPGESGNGNNSYGVNTWFSSAVVNASTWNPYLLEKLGHVYAHQSVKNALSGAYAPAMNTHRTPFGGRNFEYFSEDGFIGGKMGAAEVTGLQAEDVSVFIKHMAMNDNDTNRDGNITWFSEQSAREIYLKDYEICVHEIFVSDPETESGEFVKGEGALGIMSSLNRDGISMFHQGLYKNILRGEWGFNGMIITDGVGPSATIMSPGAGLFGGVEGQLGGSAVSAYYEVEGNSKTTQYGRYLLRQATKHMLYQFCHAAQISPVANDAWKTYLTVGNSVLGAAAVAVIVLCFVLPVVKKKKQ